MTAKFLQNVVDISVNSLMDQTELPTDISTLQEIEEIVKSNLRKISEMAHEENAWDGCTESNNNLIGIMNLQISDIVGIIDEELPTDDSSNGRILTKDLPRSSDFKDLLAITQDRSQMGQLADELLEDITIVINNEPNLIESQKQNSPDKEVNGLVSRDNYPCHKDKKETFLEQQQYSESSQEEAHFRIGNNEFFTTISEDGAVVKDKASEKSVSCEENFDQENHILTNALLNVIQDYQKQPFVDDCSSEALMAVKITSVPQGSSKSPDNISANSLIEQSCLMLPDFNLEIINEAKMVDGEPRMSSQLGDDDVTVDGESHDGADSVQLCYLSFDENLTCSFDELQLHQDESSELIEHGQPGRPPRPKANKPAVPCRIEPKVNQPVIRSSLFSHHLQTGRTFKPLHSAAMPVMMPHHLGAVINRFPVIMHNNTNSSNKLFLEVCPQTSQHSQPTYAASVVSSGSEVSSTQSDQSRNTWRSSDVTLESKISDSVLSSSQPSQDEFAATSVQSHSSLEIDGPVRHRNQFRLHESRNNPQVVNLMGNQRFTSGSPMEVQNIMQAGHHSSSSMLYSYGFDPRLFVNSGQNLMGHQPTPGFASTNRSASPYNQPCVEAFLGSPALPYCNQIIMQTPPGVTQLAASSFLNQIQHQNKCNCSTTANSIGTSSCGPHCCQPNKEHSGYLGIEPQMNKDSCSGNHCHRNRGLDTHDVGSTAAVTYSSASSLGQTATGLPFIQVDPRSRRIKMLVEAGNRCQIQAQAVCNSSGTATFPQNNVPFSTSQICDQRSGNMIELSPPAELKRPELVNQHHIDCHKIQPQFPSKASADGSSKEKSHFRPKSAHSHTSTRSSKGPNIPVPVQKSKTTVEQWLINNVMFRADLDSGTYDPSDHSLKREPSLLRTVKQYQGTERNEEVLSNSSCNVTGLFEGKKMTVVSQPPSSKHKAKKSTLENNQRKGKKTHKINPAFSDSSMVSKSSNSSGHTDNRHGSFSELQDGCFVQIGEKPHITRTDARVLININNYLENKKKGKTAAENQLSNCNQTIPSSLVDEMNENQKADQEIAEKVKLFEQKSLEKKMWAGFSSSPGNSQIFNELEIFLSGNDAKFSGGISGNNLGSGLKLQNPVMENSKQSSFDASKYITPSDIESLEKKRAQNGKSSLECYLGNRNNCSNDIVNSSQNMLPASDVKPLPCIPFYDIAEVVGSNGDLNQQPTEFAALHQSRQKAIKRSVDQSENSLVFQNTSIISNNNKINISISGYDLAALDKPIACSLSQNDLAATVVGFNKDHLPWENTDGCSESSTAKNQDNTLSAFTIENVAGPPTTLPSFSAQNQSQNTKSHNLKASDLEIASSGINNNLFQIQANPGLQRISAPQEVPQTLKSDKIQTQAELDSIHKFVAPSLGIEMWPHFGTFEEQEHLYHIHNMRAGQYHSGLVPVPSAYFNTTHNLLSSAADNIPHIPTLLPQPSSSLTPPQLSNKFKQPLRVTQVTSCSKNSSAKAEIKDSQFFQSISENSDVSMNSDTSLSSSAPAHEIMILRPNLSTHQQSILPQQQLQNQQIIQQQRIQQNQQHVQPQQHQNQQPQDQLQKQIQNSKQQQQQIQRPQEKEVQSCPEMQNEQIQSLQQVQSLQQKQTQNQQLKHETQNQHLKHETQNHHQHHQQMQNHQQMPGDPQKHSQQQMQNQQQQQIQNQCSQQMQNQEQMQIQQQMLTRHQQMQIQHQIMKNQQQMRTQYQQQIQAQQQQMQNQQQQQMKNYQQQQQRQSHQQQQPTQNHFQHQEMHRQQQMQQILQHYQRLQRQVQEKQQQSNSCIGSPSNAVTCDNFQAIPSSSALPQQSSASASSNCSDSIPTFSVSHPMYSSTYHIETHPSCSQAQKIVDQSSNSRIGPHQQPFSDSRNFTGNQDMKNLTESDFQQYLLGEFPSLGSIDFSQDSFHIPPSSNPLLKQGKILQSLAKPSQPFPSGDRMSVDNAQSAERSREDSDLSVFSVGSDVDMLSFQPDNDGETLLHLLCDIPKEGREKLSTLSSIPGFFEALNLQNNNQETALHIAVKNEDLEVVTYLISHGADVNIYCLSSQKSTRNKSAQAIYRNETVQQTALHEAVELGNTEIVRVLLTSQNVRVDAKRPDSGLTPLMLALQLHRHSDRTEIILELIRHQASLSLHDTIQGKTPLMYAIQSKDVPLVERILQQVGAEGARTLVNKRAKKDMTCLHFAAELRLESTLKKRLLRCIIVAGGDASAKNSEGETPRDWAKSDIIEVLHNLARLSNP